MSQTKLTTGHPLQDGLRLPDRYERLVEALGLEVANLLVAPSSNTIQQFELIAHNIATRGEGLFIPVFGTTGTGKTTLAMNLTHWLPNSYAPSLDYPGLIDAAPIEAAIRDHCANLPSNNKLIVPVNFDNRENSPPSDAELTAIKKVLRLATAGVHCLFLWPETKKEVADALGKRYVTIAGDAPIPLPLNYEGPERRTWPDVAIHTLALTNGIHSLEDLGVDPKDYDPSESPSIGVYLRRISQDFNKRVVELKQELQKPISIAIVFASGDTEPGVLTQLTSPTRYGLLESHALISVTSDSEIGKWWSARRGLLTRVIVQLDAHAFCLPPASSASAIRNFSDEGVPFPMPEYRRYGPSHGSKDLARCDIGKYVVGKELNRFEARGTSADKSEAAFSALADAGFNLGKDRNLNATMLRAWERLMSDNHISYTETRTEKKLDFCGLIPDNSIYLTDRVLCIEYTWRKGTFLDSSKRAAVAGYILTKLKNYASQMGWVA